MARKVARLRATLVRSVTPDELCKIVDSLVKAARGGDVSAAKLLLDRLLGPPVQADYEERLGTLERLVESHQQGAY